MIHEKKGHTYMLIVRVVRDKEAAEPGEVVSGMHQMGQGKICNQP